MLEPATHRFGILLIFSAPCLPVCSAVSLLSLLQVQQLMLDPAIEHEFQQLRTQLQMRVQETEAAKAAYEGQAFTPVSFECWGRVAMVWLDSYAVRAHMDGYTLSRVYG